jgi:regulator of protease activity HflC (stomatin/prohibitin superfamily)
MEVTKKQVFAVLAVVFGLFLILMFGKVGEDVDNEKIVVNQYPFTGRLEYWTSPGFQWQWFGRITEYDKTRQLWFSDEDGEGSDRPIDLDIPIVFNDGSKGRISGSLRVKLPLERQYLSRLHTEYAGMERIMNDLIRPTTVKAVFASGPLMSAFESYAAKKNDLIAYITDQLTNGVYRTRTSEQKVFDELTQQEKVVRVAEIVRNEDGSFARQEKSPFEYYGLEISQLSISNIRYDDIVMNQIKAQQEANMQIQTALAQSLEARQNAIKAEEQGKATAATERWKQEAIKAVEVTKAEQAKEVARLEAEQAKFIADKIMQEGRAKAEANRALVQAGLTPLEKATIEKDTKIGIAKALSEYKGEWTPKVVSSGGSGGSQNQAMDAVGIKMMLDVIDKLGK